jgi:chorismate mutase
MNLTELRKQIDALNEEIISLFARRLELTKQVAQVKKRESLPVDDFKREEDQKELLRHLAKKYQLDPDIIEELFDLFIKYSKVQMQKEMGFRPLA